VEEGQEQGALQLGPAQTMTGGGVGKKWGTEQRPQADTTGILYLGRTQFFNENRGCPCKVPIRSYKGLETVLFGIVTRHNESFREGGKAYFASPGLR
jgi:hypothetical protein